MDHNQRLHKNCHPSSASTTVPNHNFEFISFPQHHTNNNGAIIPSLMIQHRLSFGEHDLHSEITMFTGYEPEVPPSRSRHIRQNSNGAITVRSQNSAFDVIQPRESEESPSHYNDHHGTLMQQQQKIDCYFVNANTTGTATAATTDTTGGTTETYHVITTSGGSPRIDVWNMTQKGDGR